MKLLYFHSRTTAINRLFTLSLATQQELGKCSIVVQYTVQCNSIVLCSELLDRMQCNAVV